MQQRRAVRPETMTARALDLMDERLGASASGAEATFSHGVLGIAADHTMLAEGFALMLPIRDGIAVAIRESPSSTSRVVFDGEDESWEFDLGDNVETEANAAMGDGTPWWVQLLADIVQSTSTGGRQVDVAVVSTVVAGCEQTYAAALGMSALRTAQAVFPPDQDPRRPWDTVAEIVASVTDRPVTNAYSVATDVASIGQLVLVDTGTGRRLPFPTPAADPVGWGLIDTAEPFGQHDRVDKTRNSIADMVDRLQKKSFPDLNALRDLEHKDLEAAERTVSRGHRPILRYFVHENQRVHRLVTAARKGDWQLFGALLVMGHASLRDELDATAEMADAVVELAEEQTLSGMYGGRALGFSSVVCVVGQPFVVPPFLDTAKEALNERFGIAANTVLL